MTQLKNKVLSIFLIFSLFAGIVGVPVNVFGASYPVLKAEDGEFYPVPGKNYSISGVAGKETFIGLYYPDDYEGDDEPVVVSVVSSKPSVVKVSLDKDDPNFVDAAFKKAGSATITIKDEDGKKTVLKVTVKEAPPKVETADYILKNSTKVTVKAKNVKKGDIIKLKIGKKTYSKTVKKAKKSASYKFSIKKPGFSGKKFTLTLNRKGKAVATYKDYVYLNEKPGNTKASSIDYTGTNEDYSIESFKWTKASRAEGYQVRFISADSYDYDDLIVTYGRGTTNTNSISLKTPDVDIGEYFRVQVRAFRTKKDGTKVYGDWITSIKKFGAYIGLH